MVELAGIGPAPFACMMLAELGADVLRIDRPGGGLSFGPPELDLLNRGRRSAALDLKTPAAIRFDRYLTMVALLAYLAYAVPHLVFHLGHLEGAEPGWSIALAVALALSALVPASALFAARKLT